ncbi:LarC family nickel insertion protein [Neobacillus drentensis]|uniref:LarC family nickel insertion protein n=2 Tax=Neobacillus drentensis TaxID=220684 RepID=UPI002FFFBA7D
MRTLYFDCFSGISGDMVIGSLIDAGADPNRLVEELKKLHIDDEYMLTWKKLVKNGITSTKFDVVLKNVHTHNHHHDHEHTHVHDDEHDHEHNHAHDHGHDHEHNHAHDHAHGHSHEHIHAQDHEHHHHSHGNVQHHHHEHRAYKDIVALIEGAGFVEPVKNTALKIFKRIGEAEGHIHGIPLEKVHFHEVGAVDSIIDIIGAAILIHQLEIDVIKSSPIPVGTGRIHIDHGIYPVPAPATLEILKGVPIEQSDIRFELTTPTGAAIVAVLAEEYCPIPSMKVTSIGYGAGTKTFKNHPNVLRVVIGEE